MGHDEDDEHSIMRRRWSIFLSGLLLCVSTIATDDVETCDAANPVYQEPPPSSDCQSSVVLVEGIPDSDELVSGVLRNDRRRTSLLDTNYDAGDPFLAVSRFDSDFPKSLSAHFLHISANGSHEGWFVRVVAPLQECAKTIKRLVAREIVRTHDEMDVNHRVDLRGPHRLVDENGRAYDSSSSRRLHLLLPREAFVHEAVEEGFVRVLDDGKTTLTTLSLSPRVFLVDPILSLQDSQELIDISSGHLQRSAERHYSPGYENYRTSLTGTTPHHARVTRLLWERVKNITGMQEGGVERPQLLKYTGTTSWYKKHQDFFHNFESRPLEEVRMYVQTRIRELWRHDSDVAKTLNEEALHRFDNLNQKLSDAVGRKLAVGLGLDLTTDTNVRRLVHDYLVDSTDPVNDFYLVCALYASELLQAQGMTIEYSDDLAEDLILGSYDGLDLQDYVPYVVKPVQSNRHVTMLPILQAADRGGNTAFPNAETSRLLEPDHDEEIEDCKRGLIVKAESGQALMFYNRLPRGDLDFTSTHAGCPPKEGEKIAVNCFTWDADERFAFHFLSNIDELYG